MPFKKWLIIALPYCKDLGTKSLIIYCIKFSTAQVLIASYYLKSSYPTTSPTQQATAVYLFKPFMHINMNVIFGYRLYKPFL